MLIGILQCDNVRSSLSPEFGEYPETIINCFEAISSEDDYPPFTFQTYKTHEGILPDSIDECDAYLITGSRHSVFDQEESWINQLQNFIVKLNKAKKKTIGICFGHQIIAEATGGRVERADCGWKIGAHINHVITQTDFMQPTATSLNIPMLCEDQVVSISDEATLLATSENCDFAMVAYDQHMLSMQGHPEFTKKFAKSLLSIRKEEFPSKRFEKGITSFTENELDSETIFHWFANFLRTEQNQPKDKEITSD